MVVWGDCVFWVGLKWLHGSFACFNDNYEIPMGLKKYMNTFFFLLLINELAYRKEVTCTSRKMTSILPTRPSPANIKYCRGDPIGLPIEFTPVNQSERFSTDTSLRIHSQMKWFCEKKMWIWESTKNESAIKVLRITIMYLFIHNEKVLGQVWSFRILVKTPVANVFDLPRRYPLWFCIFVYWCPIY